MPVRVAVNGFGRIGRQVVKAILERHPDAEVVVLSPLVREGATPAGLTRVARLLTTQAESIGADYLDVGQPYLEDGSVADAGEQLRAAVDEVLNP